jgi:hypothetical protein
MCMRGGRRKKTYECVTEDKINDSSASFASKGLERIAAESVVLIVERKRLNVCQV